MKNLNLVLIAAVIALAGCSVKAGRRSPGAVSVDPPPAGQNELADSTSTANIPQKIAQAYGFDAFEKVRRIRFTSVWIDGEKETRHRWEWEPKEDRVSYLGPDTSGRTIETVYRRSRLDEGSASLNETADRFFRRDRYWLFFPFHLVWDKNAGFHHDGRLVMPIPPGSAERLTVTYEREPDASFGDVVEVYFGNDFVIRQWAVYRKGGVEPKRLTSWERYTRVGPLLLSLERQSADGRFRVRFEDVSVEMRDRLQ